jgi:hypothetical protein
MGIGNIVVSNADYDDIVMVAYNIIRYPAKKKGL